MLRKFWEHKITHFSVVMIVFAITGSAAAKISGLVSSLLSLDKFSITWWLCSVLIIFPTYQVLLIAVAFCFGKKDYFREKQKKTFRFLASLFSGKRKEKKEKEHSAS